MRTFWQCELPVGDPLRGPAFGERLDPNAISATNIAPAVSAGGTILNSVGYLVAGSASRQAGKSQKAAADFEAEQLRINAGQSVASAQRDALEQRRKASIVASRALAVASASGAGASDPTIMNIIADIEGRGAYNAAVAMYQGEDRARLMRMGAAAKTYEGELAEQGGKQKQAAYNMTAFGAAATGGASLYGKYGRGGPKSNKSGGDGWLDAGTEGYPNLA